MNLLMQNALDLINRQKAEIEKLNSEVKEKTETIDFLKDQVVGWNNNYCELKTKLKTAKADKVIAERHEKDARDLFKGVVGQLAVAKSEAIKEFAERLKEKICCEDDCGYHCFDCCYECKDYVPVVDKLVKEMTEVSENENYSM